MTKHIKVAIGSKNPVKLKGAQTAFELFFPKQRFVFEGVSVTSGVSDQPMSDHETLLGAKSRALAAKEALNADIGIGTEGGIQNCDGTYFCCTWAFIIDEQNRMGMGTTIRMAIPHPVMDHVHEGKSLSEAVGIVFNEENIGQRNGIYGLMSNNLITRSDGERDAVIAAIAHLEHI